MKRFTDKLSSARSKTGCLEWAAGTDDGGYGRFHMNGENRLAHVVAWELQNGPIPEGVYLCHTCDNPPCCEPIHLYLGNAGTNAADRERRFRGNHARGARVNTAKLAAEDIPVIRALVRWSGFSMGSVAREYGLAQPTVSAIIKRRSWAHISGVSL